MPTYEANMVSKETFCVQQGKGQALMKAAVLHRFGKAPRYEDFADPTPGQDEIVIQVKAVALENIDRAMAKGTHFSTHQFLPHLPAILGTDGIGQTGDGRLIGFGGMRPPYGSM